MGDVVHTLPAVAALKTIPGAHITWAIEPRWTALIEGNPHVDRVVLIDRSKLRESWRELRAAQYDVAVDFQGLVKSALAARFSKAPERIGLDSSQAREGRAAAMWYTKTVQAKSAHMVDTRLELAAAAGAITGAPAFILPQGKAEGDLPHGDFVLASPLAGWRAKQWPLEYYRDLASLLKRDFGMPLVVNGPESARSELTSILGAMPHFSGIPGLIHATRRAAAVIGVDSGPLHIAAALQKPGVAIFGPTDPARNGPYGGSMQVLRSTEAVTTYKRGGDYDLSMRAIQPKHVMEAFRAGCMPR